MEFRSEGEMRRKGGQADRTFLSWGGEGASQESVCSVTQAYTWGAGRDHLPQEFSFNNFLSEHSIVKFHKYDRLTSERMSQIWGTKKDSFEPFHHCLMFWWWLATWQEGTWLGKRRGMQSSCRSRRRGRRALWRRTGWVAVVPTSCTGFPLLVMKSYFWEEYLDNEKWQLAG